MVREIVTINIGGCGIKVGDAIWKQYCQEHQISAHGTIENRDKTGSYTANKRLSYFFDETNNNGGLMTYTPRNLFVDCESESINTIKSGDLLLYEKDSFISSGFGSSSSNYACGYYNCDKNMIDDLDGQTRKLIEHCDRINSFVLNRSTTGGNGSGLASLVLFRIRDHFGMKTNILDNCIIPSTMSSGIILPAISSCNTLLALSKGIESKNVLSIVFDNKSLSKQSKKYALEKSSDDYYRKLNDVICKTISNITLSMRNDDAYLPCFLDEFTQNLVPSPRLHFMVPSMSRAQIKKTKQGKQQQQQESKDIINRKFKSVTKKCLKQGNFGVEIEQFDKCKDKCLSVSMNYCYVDNNSSWNNGYLLPWIENQKSNFLLNSCLDNSNGFGIKCGFSSRYYDWNIDNCAVIGTMIQNNIGISKLFEQRVLNRYDQISKNKQYMHCFYDQGLENDEFENGRENVKCLIDDYNNVKCDHVVVNENGNENENKNNKDAPTRGSNQNMANVISTPSVSTPMTTPNPVLRKNVTSVRWISSWRLKKD